ncbi:MAG: WYL domain-containing protein [Campylobacterota bacterium]|nr:WYL domain-containing protein [Campylobacterota bacterium]
MNYLNRADRLMMILELLSNGHKLSTPKLAKQFNVSNKIIQTDFKEYILPLFDIDTIYYDYSSKSYISKNNFMLNTSLTLNDLSLIAILKNKSKDKYSDKNLHIKVDNLFKNYEKLLKKNNIKTYISSGNKPENNVTIQLHLNGSIANTFNKRIISYNPKVTHIYEDKSYDIEFKVSDINLIVSTIQSFMPNVGVINPQLLKRTINSNIYSYLRNFD